MSPHQSLYAMLEQVLGRVAFSSFVCFGAIPGSAQGLFLAGLRGPYAELVIKFMRAKLMQEVASRGPEHCLGSPSLLPKCFYILFVCNSNSNAVKSICKDLRVLISKEVLEVDKTLSVLRWLKTRFSELGKMEEIISTLHFLLYISSLH